MTHGIHQRSSALRFVAGWCALLLYVGASLPLGIVLAATLGALDRSHHVIVQTRADGLQVVLHHERRGIAHRHGPAARVLTLFAEPTQANQPDHVLQFGAPDSFARQTQLAASAPVCSAHAAAVITRTAPRLENDCLCHSASARLPAECEEQRLHLRSTLLLI